MFTMFKLGCIFKMIKNKITNHLYTFMNGENCELRKYRVYKTLQKFFKKS